jgi:hypothetical protein
MNTINDIDRLQEENMIFLKIWRTLMLVVQFKILMVLHPLLNLIKKPSSKLGMQRKFENSDSNEVRNTFEDG